MVFQPRQSSGEPSLTSQNSLDSLVDRITEAVRNRLVAEGVPLTRSESNSPIQHTVTTVANQAVHEAISSSKHWQHILNQGADRIGHSGETPFQPHLLKDNEGMAGKIDHTLLKPDATPDEVKRLCEEAAKYHFATVCVNSSQVGLAARYLEGTGVKPIAVVGFPLGAAATATKAFEAREAVREGAREIDMVINIGALKARDYTLVLNDIRQVVDASKPYGVKVILETSNLTHVEKIVGCALAKAAGAAFVKTSTGFGTGGATTEDIALMREVVGADMGVKASGGIRTTEDAEKMIAAGANRIGASASVAIVLGKSGDKGAPAVEKKPAKRGLY